MPKLIPKFQDASSQFGNLYDSQTAEDIMNLINGFNSSVSKSSFLQPRKTSIDKVSGLLPSSNSKAGFTKKPAGSGGPNASITKAAGKAEGVGQVANLVGSFLPEATTDPTTQGINTVTDAASKMAMQSGNPYAMAASAVYEVGSAVNKGAAALTGGATTFEKPVTGFDKVMSSNIVATLLPGASWLNAATKQKVAGSDKDLAGNISLGYQPTEGTEDKEYGGWSRVFGKKKVANAQALTKRTDTENMFKLSAQQTAGKDMMMANNSVKDIATKNYQSQRGGLNNSILSAESGAKINPAKLRNIVNKVKKHKQGGTLNVIPDGALHARKNNYEGELGDQVTNKGIPVVTYEDGNKITQHAEIERAEIIFHKQVTDQLEDFAKRFENTEDTNEQNALAIECGKFLTGEILENTKDNVGLLNTV